MKKSLNKRTADKLLEIKNLNPILTELGKAEAYFPFCKVSIEKMSILQDWSTDIDQDSIVTEIELILKDDEKNRAKALLNIHCSNINPKRFYIQGYELINLATNKPFISYPKWLSDKIFNFFDICEYYFAIQFPNHFGDEILEAYFNHLLPAIVLQNTFSEIR